MSFKKKIFTATLFFFSLAPQPSFSFAENLADVFKELTCVKDVNQYYPAFLDGGLDLDQQDRFFNCVWGFLDAVVNKKIIFHTPERDHFTKHEIFKMFHILLEYEEEKARRLTNKLLFFKKFLIGGSIDTIKDQELSDLMNLMFDYKEAYYIIHKEIPVFKKLFRGERVNSGKTDKTLEQLRKTVLLLSRAYQRESVSYTIEDLSQYPSYMGWGDLKAKAFFTLLQNLFEGALFPQKEIEGEGWPVFVNVIRRSFDFLFYHNQYLLKDLTEMQFAYNSLLALEKFFSILSSNESLFLERGFPIRNLDNILKTSLDLLSAQRRSPAFLSHFEKDEGRIHFLTRTLFVLALSPPEQRVTAGNWEATESLVSFSFPDSKFHFFEDHFTEKSLPIDYFISSEKIQKIEAWIKDYKQGLLSIHHGFIEETAVEKDMDHWLDLFFGWGEEKQMIYGAFTESDNHSKMIHLLSYQAFLSLILSHYAPEGYFNSDSGELSSQEWRKIISDLSPFLAIAFGLDGFQESWRKSLEDLFLTADLFLNSSDINNGLSRKELLDLSIHLSSALSHSQKVFPELMSLCEERDFSNCVAVTLLDKEEMLSPYPRFKDYIFPVKRQEYEAHIQKVLSGLEKEGSSGGGLLELFFLIQLMELNYYRKIDSNLSFNLEFEELFVFADSLKERVFLNIPYLYSSNQALAFLLYSFQSKEIPFFTGDELEPVRFSHWYLNPQIRSSFYITPNDFHNLAFEFYHLSQRF